MPQLRNIERLSLLLTMLGAGLAAFFATKEMAYGVVFGGSLALLNFKILARIISGLLNPAAPQSSRAIYGLVLLFKFAILAFAIYIGMQYLPMEPVGLLIGVSAIVLSIFIESFRVIIKGTPAQSE